MKVWLAALRAASSKADTARLSPEAKRYRVVKHRSSARDHSYRCRYRPGASARTHADLGPLHASAAERARGLALVAHVVKRGDAHSVEGAA